MGNYQVNENVDIFCDEVDEAIDDKRYENSYSNKRVYLEYEENKNEVISREILSGLSSQNRC